MNHVEFGTSEQPKRRASFEQDFISLACKFTGKKSHSLLDDPRTLNIDACAYKKSYYIKKVLTL